MRILLIFSVAVIALVAFGAFLETPDPESASSLHAFRPAEPPELSAGAAVVIYRESENERVLFEKNADAALPPGSLIKLLGALVVEKHIEASAITISESAVREPEAAGELAAGDRLTKGELLRTMLMESSNDAAAAFAEINGRRSFIEGMQNEASIAGLRDTVVGNPTGLDRPDPPYSENQSTANDIARLGLYLESHARKILQITQEREREIFQEDGLHHHTSRNTNELLWDEAIGSRIIGGKTGLTPNAKGCLLLVLRDRSASGVLAIAILGSERRFDDARALIAWADRLTP